MMEGWSLFPQAADLLRLSHRHLVRPLGLCHRRLGIGADQILVLLPSEAADITGLGMSG